MDTGDRVALELRFHPLMSYRGLSNWPPAWIWRAGGDKQAISGEIGVLREVTPSMVPPKTRLFLIVEHEGNEYMGCLHFDDAACCREILRVLQAHRGCALAEIGALELSQLL